MGVEGVYYCLKEKEYMVNEDVDGGEKVIYWKARHFEGPE